MTSKTRLGRSEIEVAPLAFGGNVFGWTADSATSFRLLDAWVDAGLNLVDTADVYSNFAEGIGVGASETVIGQWLAQGGRRDRIVLATKVGLEMAPGEKGLSRAYIERAVDASLRRLQTDHIDLYQSHRDDETTPVEETLAAYDALIKAGKVRIVGASNYSARRLRDALDAGKRDGLPRYETLQPLYNLYQRSGFEGPLQAVAQEYGLSVLPYFALASGFLTGKYRSSRDLEGRERGFLVGQYMTPRGFAILEAMDAVAAAHDATPAQIAIAWLLARPGVTAPVVSATSLEQMAQLIAATTIRLTPDEIAALDGASAPREEEDAG